MKFKNRRDAAKQLAPKLEHLKGENIVVYALPRGGVELGAIIAEYLNAPLDLVIPRKIGHPQNPEYAICSLTDFGGLVCNEQERQSIDRETFDKIVADQQKEAQRRREVYLKGFAPINPEGKTAIIVDDGVATGLTMKAAIASVKKRNPQKIVVAVPVLPESTNNELKNEVAEVISLNADPFYLGAVGAYYEEFNQVDDEVVELMQKFHEASKKNA